MKWNEFFVHASIDYKRFGPINAIFTSPSNRRFDKIPSNPISLRMRFAFFSLKKPQPRKIRKDFFIVHRREIAKSAAPSTPWAEGKNLLRFCYDFAMRMGVSPFLFWIYSVPLPPYPRFHPNSSLFPRFLSLSLSRQSINRRNGLIDFISRSRCPQFQFSRACVFRLVEIHRRAYVVDRF